MPHVAPIKRLNSSSFTYLWGEEKHEGFVEFALSPSVSIKPLRIAIRKAFGTGLVEMVD